MLTYDPRTGNLVEEEGTASRQCEHTMFDEMISPPPCAKESPADRSAGCVKTILFCLLAIGIGAALGKYQVIETAYARIAGAFHRGRTIVEQKNDDSEMPSAQSTYETLSIRCPYCFNAFQVRVGRDSDSWQVNCTACRLGLRISRKE